MPNPLNQHPLSAAFPAMAVEDFQTLKDSIESIGVQNPITIHEGMVLDGWHRYRAANDLGVTCPEVELEPDTDPRDFVLAQNKARRHITQAQLAMATTAVYDWAPMGTNQHGRVDTECPPSKSNAELAVIAGVHPNTIKQAKTVHAKAVPEVQAAINRGDIGLVKASAIAKLPPEQQAAALAQPMAKPAPEPTPTAAPHPVADVGHHVDQLADEPPEDDGPSTAELAAFAASDEADRLAMQKLLDSDDALATAYAEIKRLNAEVTQLRIARDGYMNQCTEAVKLVKSRDRQIAKLEARLKGAS